MPYLAVDQVDDFLESVLPKYVKMDWKDISMPLQKYWFAERLFSKAKADEMEGDHVEWRLQINNPGNFKVTGLYADDTTNRVNLLTHGSMYWSQNTTNYTYDITEKVFRSSKNAILNYMDVQEHAMYNDYFKGMEELMMGTGPTSATQAPRPPASLLWWIQPYNTGTGYGNNDSAYQLPSGATSAFLGMDPYGHSAVGTGGISRVTYSGWRNRVGVYTTFSEDDAIDTIIECMDKCQFMPAQSYAELAPGAKPQWELLTTYSRLKQARKLAQASNDNLKSDLAMYKGAVLIRGVPLVWIPAWTNQDFGLARTDGLVMGVNWATFHYYFASGLRMVKRAPYQDKDKHNVRWRVMDDSGQIVCFDCRQNFAVTSSSTVTEQD
jgi:hypothetical protein